MKLNWAERWVVNNPFRVMEQRIEMKLFERMEPLAPGATLLEIGCGRGAGACLIRQKFRPSRLLAQDLDPQMTYMAGRYLANAGAGAVDLSVADAVDIPLKDECIDAVFGFGFLHHVPAWQTALREVMRVLKPGGRYYFEELYPGLYQNAVTGRILLHPAKNRFESEDLRAELAGTGLSIKAALEIKPLGILGVALKKS